MVRSIVIPHDTERRPALVELADLGAFQEVVDGWLDLIEIPSIGVTIYMNEAARLTRGQLNTRATAFWWLHSAQPTDYPVILGDVVLTGVGDRENEGDVPEAVIEQIFHRDNFVVQVRPYDRSSWCDSFARFDSVFDAALWCLLFEATMRPGARFRVRSAPSFPSSEGTGHGEGARHPRCRG